MHGLFVFDTQIVILMYRYGCDIHVKSCLLDMSSIDLSHV